MKKFSLHKILLIPIFFIRFPISVSFRNSLFVFNALLLLFPSILRASDVPVGWEDLGLYGGQMNAIAIDPVNPNIMFAGSYYGDGLFKSTDGGLSWHSVDGFRNELVHSIDIDPRNHLTIWVTTLWNIFKSEDRGATWSIMLNWQDISRYMYSLSINPSNSNIIYIGTSGINGSNDDARVYKSTDGGIFWQETSLLSDHNVVDLTINPQNPQEIWAVTGPQEAIYGGIYHSTNGGQTWSRITTGYDEGWFAVIKVSPHNPRTVIAGGEKGLYITKDGGSTWNLWYVEENSAVLPTRAVAFDPQNPNIIYANWFHNFAKSTDGGESWPFYSISPLDILCIVIHPQNPQVLFVGDVFLGIYKSSNGGEYWQPLNQGINANHVYSSAISPGGKILAGSISGSYLKTGGSGWNNINPSATYSIAFSPADENTIYAGFDWNLGKSTDSGQSWSYLDISSYTDLHRVSSIAIDPRNPGNLFLSVYFSCGCWGEIYKSTDGGATISLVAYDEVPVNVVKVNPNNSRIVYAGTGMFYLPIQMGGIYRSSDGGDNWEELYSGVVVNALTIDPANSEIIYAGLGGSDGSNTGIIKSLDGGRTWESKSFGIPGGAAIVDIEFDPKKNNTLYAVTHRDGIYLSYDGGNYWTLLGLTDYWIYDILMPNSSRSSSPNRLINESELVPSSEVIIGSASGMLEYTGSGIGVITGMLTDALTGTGITGGTLSTNTGGIALSLAGSYVMVVPAGICQVMAESQGYLGASKPSITVASGGDTTVNFELTSLPTTFSIKEFKTNATGPVPVGSIVEFTAQAEGGTTPLYYRFWVASGYGTPNYGNWTMIQNYSPDNSCLWSPPAEGNYVIVAWVTDNPNSGKYHQVGMSLSTRYVSSHPIQVKKLSSNIAYPVTAGTPITFTTEAGGGSGPIKYQYWKTDGTQWQPIQSYSPNSTCTWTPNEPGSYIIVVWTSDTESTQDPPLAGWTCVVE